MHINNTIVNVNNSSILPERDLIDEILCRQIIDRQSSLNIIQLEYYKDYGIIVVIRREIFSTKTSGTGKAGTNSYPLYCRKMILLLLILALNISSIIADLY